MLSAGIEPAIPAIEPLQTKQPPGPAMQVTYYTQSKEITMD
jgi:hypothetical protein